jgi:hypothetical protein
VGRGINHETRPKAHDNRNNPSLKRAVIGPAWRSGKKRSEAIFDKNAGRVHASKRKIIYKSYH